MGGIALLQKWYRDLRMFEEHTYRAIAKGEPFHKFNCDVYVIVAKQTQDSTLEPGGLQEVGRVDNRGFYLPEADVDHMAAKNAKEVQKIVFKELAGFCGMDY